MFKINNQVYIIVHDQNIILEKEKINFYSNFKNYKYLFIGQKKINNIKKLIDSKKVIVSRFLPINIDELDKKLLAFTGWYSLSKNNLIKSNYVTLFEYDIEIINKLFFNKKYLINGFIKNKIYPNKTFFYKNKFIEKIFDKKNIKKDFSTLDELVYNKSGFWCSTSNFTMEKNTFNKFVDWYFNLINDYRIIEDEGSTQIHERIISVFALLNNIKIHHNDKIINHQMLNSHNFKY